MCGINGIISKKKIDDIKERINNMNNSLIHRGPDACGIEEIIEGHLVFGHRRLSIIDLDSRSNQPMKSYDGLNTIVFNGEIYNFKELKQLIQYPFSTDSDTEVLLAGLKKHGIEWIKKCNGMFAYAYYDQNENRIILGRDRLGIKPLYYYHDKDYLIFSSEIKGILNSGLVQAVLYEDAIDEYLGNRYIREPYTFFKNIYQVPSGCCLILNQDFEVTIKRFWGLPEEFNMEKDSDEEKIFDEFKYQVNSAILRRTISDVPLGTYLSGGIDSSIISAICAKYANHPIDTYTIGFPNLNEFAYAREVSERYQTNHHEILIDNTDYFYTLEKIISFKDAPLGVPNEIPLAIMSKELKKKITVVLSGEGADELMGGYGKIFRSPFDYCHINNGIYDSFYDYFIDSYEYVPRRIRDTYLKTGTELRDRHDCNIKDSFRNHPNEENVFRFFHNYHVKGLLQRVDITTMYASVEARVPFLDHELVEFSYKCVPYDLKLKWNDERSKKDADKLNASQYSEVLDSPKYLLRRMGLELLPEEVVTRKKMGFPVPLNEWFGELSLTAENILKDSEWFDYGKLNGLLNDCKSNARYGQILWMFINVELFRRMYFEKEWRY